MQMRKASVFFAILIIFCLTAYDEVSAQVAKLPLTDLWSVHMHYDPACCNGTDIGGDCHPVSCEDIIEKGKSLFYHGWEFTASMIKPSQDGSCHVCITNEFSKDMTPVPHCIYVLQNS